MPVINHYINLWRWLYCRKTKAGRPWGFVQCLKAFRGLSLTSRELLHVWKPGSSGLPASYHRADLASHSQQTHAESAHAVEVNTNQSRLIVVWMLISCFSHLTALPLSTHNLRHAQVSEGRRLVAGVRGYSISASLWFELWRLWTLMLHVNMCWTKPGLSVQLRGSPSVDELLIRVLTAGVRRSLGDSGFSLGLWEPDWACRHKGRVAAQWHHDMADFFQSVEPACFLFFFFYTLAQTEHISDCPKQTIARG